MPVEAVVTCIGESLKEELTSNVSELEPAVRDIALALLDALPQCANDLPIGIRLQETDVPKNGRRPKRPLSKYNLHMQRCLIAGGTFKDCVQQWRDLKAEENRNRGNS